MKKFKFYGLIIMFLFVNNIFAQKKIINSGEKLFFEFYNHFTPINLPLTDSLLVGKPNIKKQIMKEYIQNFISDAYNLHSLNFNKNAYIPVGCFETEKYFAVIYFEYVEVHIQKLNKYLVTFDKKDFHQISKILFSSKDYEKHQIISFMNDKFEIYSRIAIKEYDAGNLFLDECPDCFEIRELLYKYRITQSGKIEMIYEKPAFYYIAKYGDYDSPLFEYPIIINNPIFEEYDFKKYLRSFD